MSCGPEYYHDTFPVIGTKERTVLEGKKEENFPKAENIITQENK